MQNLLTDYFSSLREASYFFKDAMPSLISKTFSEIKGAFSEDELMLILTAMRDVYVVPDFAGSILRSECIDYIRMHQQAVQNFLSIHSFLDKLKRLTAFQSLYIELWAQKYWTLKKEDPSSLDIKLYASTLSHSAQNLLN
jgi:hypothetical protein